jgi:hypothetical protein
MAQSLPDQICADLDLNHPAKIEICKLASEQIVRARSGSLPAAPYLRIPVHFQVFILQGQGPRPYHMLGKNQSLEQIVLASWAAKD